MDYTNYFVIEPIQLKTNINSCCCFKDTLPSENIHLTLNWDEILVTSIYNLSTFYFTKKLIYVNVVVNAAADVVVVTN